MSTGRRLSLALRLSAELTHLAHRLRFLSAASG
jgi:hypothetical protein